MKTLSKEELRELYEKDFPLWAQINYELLRERLYELLDWENLLEEIEDMARSDLKTCISQLARILDHMYKWDHFRSLIGGETGGIGWLKSIRSARSKILDAFDMAPSLKKKLPLGIELAWGSARRKIENWLEDNGYNPEDFHIRKECPYTYEEAMTRNLRKGQ
ncbi:MAG: DUF29 domain-containing protein [Aquificaceae bacterium]